MKTLTARRLLLVITGFGISMICFGLSTEFFTAALFLALSGAFDSVSMVMRGTLMQLLIPDTMRGRVSALNGMFIISSNEIGAFESGAAASLLGLVPSIVFGGSMTLLVVGVTALFARDLRRLVIHTDSQTRAS
jgi:sugar phosphate permease